MTIRQILARLAEICRPGGDRRRLRRNLRRAAALFLAVVFGFYGFSVLALFSVRYVDPPLTALQAQRRIESWIDWRPYRPVHRPVSLSAISPHLRNAVIAAEDGGFFAHRGIDWDELQNAMKANVKRGRLWRGGSTITQQLIKNLLLTTRFSFLRKAVEFALAPTAEAILSKERILEIYLNVIEWGDGVYGAEAASQLYYGIPASRLNREQAARLAACIPAPRSRRPEKMDRYSAQILRRMTARGW